MKVVFLVQNLFSLRDYKRFGIEILSKNGFSVEVWDFTPFLFPKVYIHYMKKALVDFEGYRLFEHEQNALQEISDLPNTSFVLNYISYNIKSYKIFYMLSQKNIKYCISNTNTIPLSPKREKMLDLFLLRLKRLSFRKITAFLFQRIPHFLLGLKPANLLLAGGEKSLKKDFPISPHTKILWLHSLDYDIYLESKNDTIPIDYKFAVLIDEYLPFHPDMIVYEFNLPYEDDPDQYYGTLCAFFDRLENELGIRIIIAAHPRSNYEELPDYYKGRIILKGKTAELIKRAEFVIIHASTAVSFAVLYRKPLLFFTTDRLMTLKEKLDEHFIDTSLGKVPINLDSTINIDWQKELVVDENAYLSYINKYIKKSGTEELPSWQIFANYLKKEASDDLN